MIFCSLNQAVGFDRSTASRHAVPSRDVRRHWWTRKVAMRLVDKDQQLLVGLKTGKCLKAAAPTE